MRGGRWSDGLRRAVLALLALALLVLPLAPPRHAAMAAQAPAMADPCPGHAMPAAHHQAPGLPGDPAEAPACCAAALCGGVQVAALPLPATPRARPVALPARAAAAARLPGRAIPPEPRPPRAG
ncbi:hypothetical protein ACFQS7_18640 [Dankookia sp. GCM10030260]|uniref:hypothetical protein n=1 Tax=Dankookia sp. GCM10030260 TaxID=3273390 RepID=UPI0036080C3E